MYLFMVVNLLSCGIFKRCKPKKDGLGLTFFPFILPDGSEISRARVELELEKVEKQMIENGIPVGHITCHTLRHAFATRAIESGMKPQVLKTILGHSNISMTMDLYSQVLGDEKVQEMILLENLF